MSDKDSHRSGEQERSNRSSMNRRRMLQLTSVGLGGLAMGSLSGVAGAETASCAEGPFQRTYEGGVIDVDDIWAKPADVEGTRPDLGAASPGTDRGQGGAAAQPPREVGQESFQKEAEELNIHTEYDGVNSIQTRGGVPSDSQVAAGKEKLVHALNQQIAIFDKQSGERQQMFDLERLWKPVIEEPEGGFVDDSPLVFDPRARYDRGRDRFVICATQFQAGITEDGEIIDREEVEEEVDFEDVAAEAQAQQDSRPPRGWFLVAVSATSDPNGKWYVYRIPPLENRGLVDYPTLGLDEDAIYMTQNFFPRVEGLQFDVTMVTLDKEAMYEGRDVTTHHFNRMSDPDADGLTFTVQPALQPFCGGEDGTYYMVNSDFPTPSSGTLTLWELNDPVDDPTLECHTLQVGEYSSPPTARQPGSTSRIDTLGTRVMNADYNDGSLWTAHSLAFDWNGDGTSVSAIRWYEIDVESREVVQDGVYGEPGKSYFIPTIGSDRWTTVISHNVSGPETYVQANAAGRTTHHPQGELEDSIVVEPGKSPYDALEADVERWGDYNGVSVDPVSGTFWTVSQYSPDIDIPVENPQRDPYFTRIAEVSFNACNVKGGRGDRNGDGDDGRGGRDGESGAETPESL